MNKKAFSFVELIIAVVIIILLGIVGFTINHSLKIKTTNGKVSADVLTIKSGIELYKTESSELLKPKGNLNYFTASGTYAHDKEEAYGVYGKFTENTLAKKYLDIVPLDPKTNQYYSYGVKIVDNKNGKGNGEFEVAGVLEENEEYKAKVVGNYDLIGGISSLIREYNGPRFVKDTYGYLPYNPETRLFVARDLEGNVFTEGMEVIAGTKDLELYLSDGSVMKLKAGTTLKLEEMHFKNDNNLFSAIKAYLSAGSVWIQASKLDTDSSFEIHTQDFEAAVRGTSFNITPNEVVVYKGLVEVTPKGANSVNVSEGQKYSAGQVSDATNIIVPNLEGKVDYIATPINIIDEYSEELISIGDDGKCYLEDKEIENGKDHIAFKEKESLNCEGITKVCKDGIMIVPGMDISISNEYMYKECNTITLPWQDCKEGDNYNGKGKGAGYDYNSYQYREGISNDTWKYVDSLTFGNTCEFTCKDGYEWKGGLCLPPKCGEANGKTYSIQPAENLLCEVGSNGIISETTDKFTWTCEYKTRKVDCEAGKDTSCLDTQVKINGNCVDKIPCDTITHDYNATNNTCTPKNCNAKIIGQYRFAATNHNTTIYSTNNIIKTVGTKNITYQGFYKCMYGEINTSGEGERDFSCIGGYTKIGNDCVPEQQNYYCNTTKPSNTYSQTDGSPTTNGQVWTASINTNQACRFTCNAGYIPSGSTCTQLTAGNGQFSTAGNIGPTSCTTNSNTTANLAKSQSDCNKYTGNFSSVNVSSQVTIKFQNVDISGSNTFFSLGSNNIMSSYTNGTYYLIIPGKGQVGTFQKGGNVSIDITNIKGMQSLGSFNTNLVEYIIIK